MNKKILSIIPLILLLIIPIGYCIEPFDTFETGAIKDFWTIQTNNPYNVTSDSEFVYEGSYSLVANGENGGLYYNWTDSEATKEFNYDFAIITNPDNPPVGASSQDILWLVLGDDEDGLTVQLVTNITGVFIRVIDDDMAYVDSSYLELNEWMHLKYEVIMSGSTLTQRYYINGVEDCELVSTINLVTNTFYEFTLFAPEWITGIDCRTTLDNWGIPYDLELGYFFIDANGWFIITGFVVMVSIIAFALKVKYGSGY